MQKLHLDLSVVSGISQAYLKSSQEISKISGQNLGNLVFRHALISIIEDYFDFDTVNYQEFADRIRTNNPDLVIISCANWLGTKSHDERSNKFRADLLEPLNCNIVSFGLGVQAPQGADSVTLGPESQRLAKVLASKTSLLSVRDQLTAKVLRGIGIDNICITGCPSNFINTRPDLGNAIARKAELLARQSVPWNQTRVAISEFSGGHKVSGSVLRRMFEVMNAAPSFYIVQSPELLPLLYGESKNIPDVYSANSGLSIPECLNTLKSTALAFSNVEAWLDFSRTCDLSFGMRIHGTMVPLQAEVPSLMIGHDSRTLGLAHEMCIPGLTPQAFMELSLEEPVALWQEILDQIQQYDDNRSRLAKGLVGFLFENNLPATQKLLDLAQSASIPATA
jgi:hypothetical protein